VTVVPEPIFMAPVAVKATGPSNSSPPEPLTLKTSLTKTARAVDEFSPLVLNVPPPVLTMMLR